MSGEMERTVWKYGINLRAENLVVELHNPKVVHVGIDPTYDLHMPTVWIEHQPEGAKKQKLELMVVGTGHPITEDGYSTWNHVGSCITPHEAPLVWHVDARSLT
jgi:hypothetical protein